MKKLLITAVILILLLPAVAFAESPDEIEVQQTTAVVLSTFGIVFFAAMFGQTPEGIEIETDETAGVSRMICKNFNPGLYFAELGELDSESEAEMPEVYFESMSGTLSVDSAGDMTVDMKLKGGNIDTLELKTSGETFVYFRANGKDYSYLDSLMEME